MQNRLDALRLTEAELKLRYLRSVCELQLEYARRRQTTLGATKLQMWIRSTFQKDSFAWCMVRANCVRVPVAQNEICEITKLSRQSVSEMIKHCLAESWIEIYCDDKKIDRKHASICKGTLKYCAGGELMAAADAFIDRHIATTNDTFMNGNWDDLMAIRRAIKAIQ